MQVRDRDRSEWAELERPWESPAFWQSVEDAVSCPDPGELAEFLRPAVLSEPIERSIWARLCARLDPSRRAVDPATERMGRR